MGYKPRDKDKDESRDTKNSLTTKEMTYNRSCTDVLCCVIFVIFLIVVVIICGYGFVMGDPVRIMTPFDSDGNHCGL